MFWWLCLLAWFVAAFAVALLWGRFAQFSDASDSLDHAGDNTASRARTLETSSVRQGERKSPGLDDALAHVA